MADYICRRPDEFQERRILELGAASALPSILSLLIGNASFVLATDYPSDDLIENMIYNLNLLIPSHKRNRINALGFLWGDDEFIRKVCLKTDDQSIDLSKRLGHHIEHSKYAATSSKIETKDCVLDLQESNLKFNVILLCDVVFNHSEHQKLIKSCKLALNDAGVVWVTFTHYRPWLKEKDLAFLKLAESHGFTVEHIESIVYDSFLFPEDALDPRVIDPLDLRTVHAYRLHLTPE